MLDPSLKRFFTDGRYQLAVLVVGLVLYLVLPYSFRPYVGLLVGIYIIVAFIVDTAESASQVGWREELKELFILVVVVLVIYYGLGFILATSAPISSVVSCSMAPSIQRGDLIIISNRSPPHTLYAFNISPKDFIPIISHNYTVYYDGRPILHSGQSLYVLCSPSSLQQSELSSTSSLTSLCSAFNKEPSRFKESLGPLFFDYTTCIRKNGEKQACVAAVEWNGKTYPLYPKRKSSNLADVIVYEPRKGTLFRQIGQIIHRAIIEIDVNGELYYLTKGDNNNVFDIQFSASGLYNEPPSKTDVIGRVIFRVPLLGYYKLFLSPYLRDDPMCKNYIVNIGAVNAS